MSRLRRARALSRRVAPLLAPHRPRLVLAGACMVCFVVLDLLAPWPVQMVLDGVLLGRRGDGLLGRIEDFLPQGREPLLLLCTAGLVAIALLRSLVQYGQNLNTAAVGHQVVAELRCRVFERLQALSLGFHARHRQGDLLVRLTGDVAMLREILVPALLETSSRLLLLAAMVGVMAMVDPMLTILALALLPALALATVRLGGRIRSVAREQRRKEGRLAAVAGESLASIAIVQAFSRGPAMAERFRRNGAKSLRAGLRSLRLEESLSRTVELTLAAGSCIVLWVGARRVLANAISPGELVVFLTYLRGLYKPIAALVRTAGRANKAVACGERIFEVLDSGEQVPDVPDATEAPPLRGEIVFDRVTFGYDPGRPVLRELSFRVRAGERLALVGPSGSGKSTVAALLLRLHDPQQGRILVDGRDLRSLRVDSYRAQLAVVMQEPCLFGVSVADNVRQGRPAATEGEIWSALQAAGAASFVRELPHGVATVLGERGASLSRGQQQRIALARAVVRHAPVMLFDEPTTGLDARVQAEVVGALADSARGRTCLWIAHDLDQILDCARAVVLRQGRVVEEGAPAALLERAGAFRTLFGESHP